MEYAARPPMLTAGTLSAALHAAALAVVLVLHQSTDEVKHEIAVEVAWVEGSGGEAAQGANAPRSASAAAPAPAAPAAAVAESLDPAPAAARVGPGEISDPSGSLDAAMSEAPGDVIAGPDRAAAGPSREAGGSVVTARQTTRTQKHERKPSPIASDASRACAGDRNEGVGCTGSTESPVVSRPQADQSDGRKESGPEPAMIAAASAAATGSVSSGASPGDAAAGPAFAGEGDVVERVQPTYPMTARRQGVQGTTTVRARFDAEGRPEDVVVVGSSGSRSLDDAARDAVKRWRFRAGAAGVLDMPITFRLNAGVGG